MKPNHESVRGEPINDGLERQPRATQEEMSKRENHVLRKLDDGPISIAEIFMDYDLTYSQQILLLKRMEDFGSIRKIGKDGRNIIYAKNESTLLAPAKFEQLLQQINTGANVKIVALKVTSNDLSIDLEFPTGQVVNAQLCA